MKFATRQENYTYQYICDMGAMYISGGLFNYQFSRNDSVEKYKQVIKNYRKGLLAIYPKFHNGVTMSNDFAIHIEGVISIAIECKERTTTTVSPTEINKEIVIREGKLIEKQMVFFLEGNYTERKRFNVELLKMPTNFKVVYDIEQLNLFQQ